MLPPLVCLLLEAKAVQLINSCPLKGQTMPLVAGDSYLDAYGGGNTAPSRVFALIPDR
jgi:hypothetical protein